VLSQSLNGDWSPSVPPEWLLAGCRAPRSPSTGLCSQCGRDMFGTTTLHNIQTAKTSQSATGTSRRPRVLSDKCHSRHALICLICLSLCCTRTSTTQCHDTSRLPVQAKFPKDQLASQVKRLRLAVSQITSSTSPTSSWGNNTPLGGPSATACSLMAPWA